MMKRWVCPKCDDGCLAPGKPRRDDVRRYCFPCSTKSGRLVQRVCPTAERQREAKAARRGAAAQAEREREHARANTYPYVLRKVFSRYARLRSWEADITNVSLTLRIGRKGSTWTSGHCHGSSRITITAGTGVAEAHETVLHELAHAATVNLGRRLRKALPAHGVAFKGYLLAAAAELLGHTVLLPPGPPSTRDVDEAITAGLRAMLAAEGTTAGKDSEVVPEAGVEPARP